VSKGISPLRYPFYSRGKCSSTSTRGLEI
jgi:hypothetical protein